jgi:hypothetical protein
MTDSKPSVIARDVLLRVAEHADRYAIHAALDERWGRRGEVGYLWTLGRLADGPAARVRLAPMHPDAAYGLPVIAAPAGTELRFRLHANVTHKDGRTAQRRSWPREEIGPRLQWLQRRALEHGFGLRHVDADVARAFVRKGKGFWIDDTTFTGVLTVLDAARFAAALTGGVGQRPAFGFGLLETF